MATADYIYHHVLLLLFNFAIWLQEQLTCVTVTLLLLLLLSWCAFYTCRVEGWVNLVAPYIPRSFACLETVTN